MSPNPLLRSRSLVALLVLAAAGCGGRVHRSSGDSGTLTSDIVLTVGPDYNGSGDDLTGTPTDTLTSSGFSFRLAEGNREVVVTIPVSAIATGGTITPSTPGASFTYTESSQGADGGTNKVWTATGGSVAFSNVVNGKANVTVSGLQFSPSSLLGNNALGTFTADGTVRNLPVSG